MNTQHLREMIQSAQDELQLAQRSAGRRASAMLVLINLSCAIHYLRAARAELRRLERASAR